MNAVGVGVGSVMVILLWVGGLCMAAFGLMVLLPLAQNGAPWETWRPGFFECMSIAILTGMLKFKVTVNK